MSLKERIEFIEKNKNNKPLGLVIDDLYWKTILLCIITNKNLLLVGPTRCGKTTTVHALKQIFKDRPFFDEFNMGQTTDAKSYLLGNIHLKNNETQQLYIFHCTFHILPIFVSSSLSGYTQF